MSIGEQIRDAIRNESSYLDISLGRVKGKSVLLMVGHATDIDTVSGTIDMWEENDTKSYLTTGETMNIVSTSADDDSDDRTGARTVLITGLLDDGAYTEASEVVLLQGVTPVATVNSYLRINGMVVLTAGSNGNNAGTITATASTAGTVQSHMDTGEGIQQGAHYTVPGGKVLVILRVEFNAAKLSGGGNPVVEFIGEARRLGVIANAAWVQVMDRKLDTAVQDQLEVDQPVGPVIPAGTDLRVRANTDTNNTEARCRLYCVLADA